METLVEYVLTPINEHVTHDSTENQNSTKQESVSEQEKTVIKNVNCESCQHEDNTKLKSAEKSEYSPKHALKSTNKASSVKSKSKMKSFQSKHSKTTDVSNVSSMYINQKVKVEEIRVIMKYAKQEAEL